MPVTINGTTGITTPDLDSTADISANSVPFGKGTNSVATNTAAGIGALSSNTSGVDTTAYGYQAGFSHTSAGQATFAGYQSGYSNTTGYGNSAFGFNSLRSATTGYTNTAIGRRALFGLTTGFSNTALGNGSGEAITTGNSNVVVGNYTGNQNGIDIRTQSNWIVLSDGDGNPRLVGSNTGAVMVAGTGFGDSSIAGMQNGDSTWVERDYVSTSGANRVLTIRGTFNYFFEITVMVVGNSAGSQIGEARWIAGRRDYAGSSHLVNTANLVGSCVSFSTATSDSGNQRTFTITITNNQDGANNHWMIKVRLRNSDSFSIA